MRVHSNMATKQQGFTPQSTRTLLSVALTLAILGGAALFYFGLGIIKEYSSQVNGRVAEAETSQQQSSQLQELAQQVTQNEALLAKADRLFIGADTYQAQVLTDIKNYAAQTGLSLAGTDFQDTSSGSYNVSIRFSGPVSYDSFVQFLLLVESNIPKMQPTSVEIARTADPSTVEIKNITINVSVK
jgi:hypothetical protein